MNRPTIGRTVVYSLSADDVAKINAARQKARKDHEALDPALQAHDGQWEEEPGAIVPMIVTRVWTDTMVNGQAILDGNDSLWVTSVEQGDGPGQWSWPVRE